MTTSARGRDALLERWVLIQMHVRCGLSPHCPDLVRLYVGAGARLARRGILPAALVHLRTLHNLVQAAHDEALPWAWRSVCLDHVDGPLAQATAVLARRDPAALAAIEAAVQFARDKLPALPPR